MIQKQYVADLEDSVRAALKSLDPTPCFQKYGASDNSWAIFKAYLNAVARAAGVREARVPAGTRELTTVEPSLAEQEELELIPPPRRTETVDLDGLGPHKDLVVEGGDENTQFSCALRGQGVQHGFEVIAEVPHVTTAGNSTPVGCQRIRDQPERPVGKGLPVPERLGGPVGQETGAFEPP